VVIKISLSEIQQRELINSKNLEYERYYKTVTLTLGIKYHLDSTIYDCNFISAEPRLKLIDEENEINPDFILQYDDNKKGILGEIKTTIPINEDYVLNNEFKQIEKYCKKVTGWNTITKNVESHDVLCFIYLTDSDRLVNLFKKFLSEDKVNIICNVCISEFSTVTSLKIGEGDVLLLKHKYGTLGCKTLTEKLMENIKIRIDELQEKYEVCKFTRKEPPIEYMMDHLWMQIFPVYAEREKSKEQDITVGINELLETIHTFYVSWTGLTDEHSQVRETWIKKSLEKFIEIELAEEIEDKPGHYKIFYGKQIPHNFRKYLIEKCSSHELEKIGRKTRKISKEQTTLIETNS